jgi:hypothetical protein
MRSKKLFHSGFRPIAVVADKTTAPRTGTELAINLIEATLTDRVHTRFDFAEQSTYAVVQPLTIHIVGAAFGAPPTTI